MNDPLMKFSSLSNYPKVYRLPLHKLGIEGFEEQPDKYYMPEDEMELLLGPGLKYVREKMCGVSREFRIGNFLVYYEDVKIRRVIPYTQLPDYNFVYAVKGQDGSNISMTNFLDLTKTFNWYTPPILLESVDPITIEELLKLARQPSSFNPDHVAEGIIIINESLGLEGKIINPEYDDNRHPDMYKDLEMEVNQLA